MALTDSLISYWKLDEASGNALDAHGSNDLTETSGTIGAATGKITGARDFEAGDTEYFTHADNADLSVGDIDFTLAFWFQLESDTTGDLIGKFDSGASTGNSEYTLRYDAASDRLQWYVSTGGSFIQVIASNFGAPSLATWYHVVVWHDAAANEIGIAVNAGTPNTTGIANGPPGTGGGFAIGRPGDVDALYFDGLICEVGFWKRVLTSDERTELYNAGAGLAYPFTGDVDSIVPLLMHMARMRAG